MERHTKSGRGDSSLESWRAAPILPPTYLAAAFALAAAVEAALAQR
jgi:hypothetical protein